MPVDNDIMRAATNMFMIMQDLGNPERAANAMAIARAHLHAVSGGTTEQKVRAMMEEDNKAALGNWSKLTKIPLSQ